ncbi:MAG: tRNA dihydrouridine synthase DusB [Lachnospiraceae bacterium]
MKIGSVTVNPPVAMGPMAGVTDLPFRKLAREFGCGLVVTEMVSAKALSYGSEKTEVLLRTEPSEHPVSVQMFGSDPVILSEMAKRLEEYPFDIIDLNMGCPVPKVTGNGEGSALMKDPKRAGEILRAMVRAVRKPVTVKIRAGWNAASINAPEIAKIAEDAGVAAIAVHGRTREQFYSGTADWDVIRRVKESVSIPVFGNGDVRDGTSALAMLRETGCDGVMVARAARGNPWIFAEIGAALSGKPAPPRPTEREIAAMILRHARMQCDYYGEKQGILQMRKQVGWYTAGLANSAALRRYVNLTETYAGLESLMEWFLEQNESRRPQSVD